MKKNILVAALAGILLAGCDKDQQVDVTSSAPGTAGDFKKNIRDRVFFNYDESCVTADAKKVLEQQSVWLKTYANTKATVVGKADERGTREYNITLGERRANNASKVLSNLGVDASRLTTVSYGKDRPEVANAQSEEQHAQNRVAVTEIN
jgi:peptidoglycan-associated lipoprotein